MLLFSKSHLKILKGNVRDSLVCPYPASNLVEHSFMDMKLKGASLTGHFLAYRDLIKFWKIVLNERGSSRIFLMNKRIFSQQIHIDL